MPSFAQVVWDSSKDEFLRKLRNGPALVRKASVATANRMAPEVANYAKVNAPWTDRTGNARNGLMAQPYDEGDNVGIVVYHSVSYGIWLEVRWAGKYAIIGPTIEVMGPRVMSQYHNLLDRL